MKAYIMVKTREPRRMKEYLRGLDKVTKVHLVYGGFDLVVEVETEDIKELGRLVLEEIRGRFPVEETVTLIVAD